MAEIASMTGFADAAQAAEGATVSVELRSVNARFLEIALRIPEELRLAEGRVRERIGAALSRGKIECRVALSRDTAASGPRLDARALEQLSALSREVRAAMPDAPALGIGDVLRWPGIVDAGGVSGEALLEPLLATLDRALSGLRESRRREGAALAGALLERCDGIAAITLRLREAAPRILADLERRTQERLAQTLGAAISPSLLSREEIAERIRQEVTLLGLRADIAEELDRLGAHVAEVRRILAQGGGVGRRLDFLLQELNRESNTVASKASAIDMTQAAVELKLLIEQMREQVQNLE